MKYVIAVMSLLFAGCAHASLSTTVQERPSFNTFVYTNIGTCSAYYAIKDHFEKDDWFYFGVYRSLSNKNLKNGISYGGLLSKDEATVIKEYTVITRILMNGEPINSEWIAKMDKDFGDLCADVTINPISTLKTVYDAK